ncbi:hypothetical protein Syun_012113 [Stephania yunnanensis]|uniref:Uncharacterized protein n=1 Tax=Stephania yunnanensis TaxID=152371 RepID=A0AAP0K090_9MAGN
MREGKDGEEKGQRAELEIEQGGKDQREKRQKKRFQQGSIAIWAEKIPLVREFSHLTNSDEDLHHPRH